MANQPIPSTIAATPANQVLQVPSAQKLEVTLAIPPIPWYHSPGLVGALTFVGVMASLYANHRKMHSELQAASAEAHRERITAARIEVYKELIAQFVESSKLLGALPLIDTKSTPNYADALLPLAASVNRTWLVSDIATASQAREVHSRVNELFMAGVAHMPALQRLKELIRGSTDVLERAQAKRHELFEELQRFAIADERTPAYDRVQSLMSGEERVAIGAFDKRCEYEQEHSLLVNKYMEFMVPQLNDIMKGVQTFMFHAREELGIPGDNGVLEMQTSELFERAQASIVQLTSEIRRRTASGA